MINTLRKKFMITFLLPVSIILIGGLAGICVYMAGNAQKESVMVLERALEHPQGQLQPKFEIGKPPQGEFHRDIVFIVQDGKLVEAERVEITEENLQAMLAAVQAQNTKQGVLQEYAVRYQIRGTRIAFVDITSEQAMMRNIIMTCIIAGAFALLAFFALSILLARWLLRPVETAWAQQQQFISDASHELKTPLTVILANTELLKTHPQDTIAQQINWVDNTLHEAARMKSLLHSMLFLAKNENGAIPVELIKTNLSDVFSQTALSFEAVAFEQNLTLCEEIEQNIFTLANTQQLQQLAGVLMDNAIKYANKGTTVTIKLYRQNGHPILQVHNVGLVIEEEEKQYLFDRFYRADASRSNEGYGLGLSIAAHIAQGHKAKLTVESDAQAGTTFKVTFRK